MAESGAFTCWVSGSAELQSRIDAVLEIIRGTDIPIRTGKRHRAEMSLRHRYRFETVKLAA